MKRIKQIHNAMYDLDKAKPLLLELMHQSIIDAQKDYGVLTYNKGNYYYKKNGEIIVIPEIIINEKSMLEQKTTTILLKENKITIEDFDYMLYASSYLER